MKRKYSILSLLFSLMVLSAILLQSFHSFQHLEKFMAEKHCHHKYALNKTEINHSHHDFDHCFVCEFALSTYTPAKHLVFSFKKPIAHQAYTFAYSKQITQSFRGALFALRAPPSSIA
jgi:hypothetical protein